MTNILGVMIWKTKMIAGTGAMATCLRRIWQKRLWYRTESILRKKKDASATGPLTNHETIK